MLRPSHPDHGGSCLVTPALRSLTTLPNRNGVLCQSSIVPVALVRLVKSRAPKLDEYFDHGIRANVSTQPSSLFQC